MSSYQNRIPHFIEGTNENDVRKKLLLVAEQMGQKIELVNVYWKANSGKVVAWYFHDIQASALPPVEVKKTKKKTKKKV